LKVILSIDAIKYPLTGIGRYVFELANQLVKIPEIDSLRYFRGARFVAAIPDVGPEKPVSQMALRSAVMKSRLAVSLYSFVSTYQKKKSLLGREDHIFHGPNFYLPSFSGPSVATIHDISQFVWPECHPPERVRYMTKEISLSLKRATMLVTDSEYTRREVAEYFGYPLDKIGSIPLASSEVFHSRSAADLHVLKSKYRLEVGGYCLFAGTVEPRKNIAGLLDAYEMLPEAVRRCWPLVVAGYKGWRSDDLHDRLKRAEASGWARYLGYVDAADLPLLFAGARLFVFPSLYEGFGLPVLEAMASGVPVVCSNSSSLPEVAGDAAAMCEANDIDQLSSLIAVGLEDDDWRTAAVEKGLARAEQFNWQRCAEKTAGVYRKAAKG